MLLSITSFYRITAGVQAHSFPTPAAAEHTGYAGTYMLNLDGDVHSIEQKSIGQKFSKSRTVIHETYSCHHNFSGFSPRICAFVTIHSLPFITINHTAIILTENKIKTALFEIKKLIKIHQFSQARV